MRLFLCNEVVRDLEFASQCRFARETGYDGLEVAPFTLDDDLKNLTSARLAEFRNIADDQGVAISGLHWLMATPAGLSITADDYSIAEVTLDHGRRLIDLCVQLGGTYLVHGSPAQRTLERGREEQGRKRAGAYFAAIAAEAENAGVRYIIEPLSRLDTGLINTVDDALEMIEHIGSPALGTMIDCYAASANGEDIVSLLQCHVPRGHIAHVHFNDDNKRGPGEGNIDFAGILDTLAKLNYSGAGAVEPFIYLPHGQATAARSIGYLRGVAATAGC